MAVIRPESRKLSEVGRIARWEEAMSSGTDMCLEDEVSLKCSVFSREIVG
jgi:hypothetical protein